MRILPIAALVTVLMGYMPDSNAKNVSASRAEAYAQGIRDWDTLVQQLMDRPEPEQIGAINTFFNNMTFRNDQQAWGSEDYWASPLEFLHRRMGDCEDYAIAKYISLRRVGIPDDRLRLVYVRSLTLKQAHMVALVETEKGEKIVLDNLTDSIQSPLARTDLEPVYSFNGIGLWLLDRSYEERRIGDASRLKKWVALQQKTRNREIWLPQRVPK